MSTQNGYTILRHQQKKIIFDRLKNKAGVAYYREGHFSDEIIWDGRKFIFPQKRISEGMWIFRSVITDVREFIQNKKIREKEKLPVNRWNPKLKKFRGKITATDVDHAYWRIAYMQGYISERTYLKGLQLKNKSLRLASLANLSSAKEYRIIQDGYITDKTVVLKYDPILQKIYNNIRYSCYEIMNTLAERLGEDFICYKTDCIYYKDSEKNRLTVQSYLDELGLEWKQMIEPERPKADVITKKSYKVPSDVNE